VLLLLERKKKRKKDRERKKRFLRSFGLFFFLSFGAAKEKKTKERGKN
jgi:hypothetical protein